MAYEVSSPEVVASAFCNNCRRLILRVEVQTPDELVKFWVHHSDQFICCKSQFTKELGYNSPIATPIVTAIQVFRRQPQPQ